MQSINPNRLILARESRGFTQTELNNKLGLSVTTYSKMENGEIHLGEDLLTRIATITGYPVSFFSAPGTASPGLLAARMREKVAQKLITPLEAHINILRLLIQDLTRSLAIKPPLLLHWDVTDTFTPVEIAHSLRKLWRIPDGPISNLTRIIENAGIPVRVFHFGTERIDSRSVLTDDKLPVICINGSHTADRQRFSLAYQLGHLVMHTFTSVDPKQDTGHNANLFAAELLMPESELTETFSAPLTLPTLGELKKRWKVSMIALLYRADDLGYITQNQKRYLMAQFNALKLRRREPVEFDVTPEEPRLIRKWLATLKRRERLDTARLAARLHFTKEEFITRFG